MRARKKKHGAERLAAVSDYFIQKPILDANKKTYLEIGCGKGKFIIENAERNPDINYIAVEKVSDVILLAAEKASQKELKNVKFMICDAKGLTELFDKHSVDLIYLNFSDPWPKAGHYKRRLTYKAFLDVYREILKEDGAVFFKTDNTGLFEFSLEQFKEDGWRLENVTDDLHNSEFAADNIMTEYEKNFSEKGFTIHRLEAWVK
ncbi:MAG: tRNA (guanosine(46)-N7)-methyltransferase TrmB [Ruminococcaceae bacterium]|nr:tRNA (guanosine(46)-N7)-methyltransferase TrmB [Oscillospiraceae bacterium]